MSQLPNVPELIILSAEEMGIEEDPNFEIGGYDEFQMLAEVKALRERMRIKQSREAHRHQP